MTSKSERKLQKKSVRAMLTWAHYCFKKHLLNKAIETNKEVIEICEAFTSQTASWDGEIVKIGGSSVIKSGGLTGDRDLNGARGVFLRLLVGLSPYSCLFYSRLSVMLLTFGNINESESLPKEEF